MYARPMSIAMPAAIKIGIAQRAKIMATLPSRRAISPRKQVVTALIRRSIARPPLFSGLLSRACAAGVQICCDAVGVAGPVEGPFRQRVGRLQDMAERRSVGVGESDD